MTNDLILIYKLFIPIPFNVSWLDMGQNERGLTIAHKSGQVRGLRAWHIFENIVVNPHQANDISELRCL